MVEGIDGRGLRKRNRPIRPLRVAACLLLLLLLLITVSLQKWQPFLTAAATAAAAAAPTAPASCRPTGLPWAELRPPPDTNRAAVFAAVDLEAGDATGRHLLTALSAMQGLGYSVDVLVTAASTACRSKAQLLQLAAGLRIVLKPDQLSLHVVTAVGSGHIQAPTSSSYDLFVLLDQRILPAYEGLGYVNLYQLLPQGSSDLPPLPAEPGPGALPTYDYVLLDSEAENRRYNSLVGPALQTSLRQHGAAPMLVTVPLSIQPLVLAPAPNSSVQQPPPRRHVVLHSEWSGCEPTQAALAAAIDLFQSIASGLPKSAQLHLVVDLPHDHDDSCFKDLRKVAAKLTVHFHTRGPFPERIFKAALVQWGLSAGQQEGGAAVLTGMAAGAIPIVLQHAVSADFVEHGVSGYVADDVASIGHFTRLVFGLDNATVEQLRSSATAHARHFSPEAFAKSLGVLATRGALTKPFRFLIEKTADIVNSRSFVLPATSTKAAVIIEPRQHYAFEYVVKNVMYHLGKEWALYVYHGQANEAFVHHALESISNVKFRRLDAVELTIPKLNHLLKSPGFWSELDAEHVLFFQTDSLLVHGNIDPFLEYDYVGAPWHRDNERWGPMEQQMPHGVGNGGLSLRSVPAMLQLSQQFGLNSTDGEQEDFWYSSLMERLPQYHLPPRDVAYKFSIEVACVDLEGAPGAGLATLPHVPLALHSAWYYFSRGNGGRFRDLCKLLELSIC